MCTSKPRSKLASAKQPVNNRHMIALLTFIGLLPLVYYIPPFIADNITGNHLLVTVLAVAIIVPIISYV
ncbi:hypothetical protein [Thalassotalea litorea]|uniref:hypothetical protein n=1 Tax=Thalassotalea litorea TaxID=2020715 RepID=UPI003736C449